MTLNEAIEILKDSIVGVEAFDDPGLPNAIKLGIEALRYIDTCHKNANCFNISPLPGETED